MLVLGSGGIALSLGLRHLWRKPGGTGVSPVQAGGDARLSTKTRLSAETGGIFARHGCDFSVTAASYVASNHTGMTKKTFVVQK
jgi:hypothetical protein